MSKKEEQQPGESDADFFKRWKKHVKEDLEGAPKAAWLKDAIGKEVEIYCTRAPKVHGTVRGLDLRFGKVLVENDEEIIEVSMSAINQVRYAKP